MLCFNVEGRLLDSPWLKNCSRNTEKYIRGLTVASYRPNLDKRNADGIPSLEEVESGKLLGAILPMSEQAQTQLRDSIEVIDYLMNQESVVWS